MLIHACATPAMPVNQDLKPMPAIFDATVSSAQPLLGQRRVAALKAGLAVTGKWLIDKRSIDVEAAG